MNTPSTSDDTDQRLRDEYVQVLVQAVKSLLAEGRTPTASQVRTRLGDITHGGFDLKRVGFLRFREFLDFGERSGSITIDRSRPGDVAVSLPGFEHESTGPSRSMRRDLWAAFLAWGQDTVRYYDRSNDCIRNVPVEVAPLEPENLTQLRKAIQDNPSQYIAVVPIERDTQIAWMHQFAVDVPDLEVKRALLVALASANAAGEFVTVLKNYPTELRRWYALLTRHVDESIKTWMSQNQLEIELWVEGDGRTRIPSESAPDVTAEPRASEQVRELLNRARHSMWIPSDKGARSIFRVEQGTRVKVQSVEHLRTILHAAIDRMPADQLRQISIPVGYLIDL